MSGALSGDGVLFKHHWPKILSQYTGNTDYTIMFNIDLLLVKILFYNWYWLQWLYFKWKPVSAPLKNNRSQPWPTSRHSGGSRNFKTRGRGPGAVKFLGLGFVLMSLHTCPVRLSWIRLWDREVNIISKRVKFYVPVYFVSILLLADNPNSPPPLYVTMGRIQGSWRVRTPLPPYLFAEP